MPKVRYNNEQGLFQEIGNGIILETNKTEILSPLFVTGAMNGPGPFFSVDPNPNRTAAPGPPIFVVSKSTSTPREGVYNVGIGNPNPSSRLHILSNGNEDSVLNSTNVGASFTMSQFDDNADDNANASVPRIEFAKGRGSWTLAGGTITPSGEGDRLGQLKFSGYRGTFGAATGVKSNAVVFQVVGDGPTDSGAPGRLELLIAQGDTGGGLPPVRWIWRSSGKVETTGSLHITSASINYPLITAGPIDSANIAEDIALAQTDTLYYFSGTKGSAKGTDNTQRGSFVIDADAVFSGTTYVESLRSTAADNQPVGQMTNGELVIHSSDRRLKTDFTEIENPLEKVMNLKGIYYTPVENLEKRYIGFVAQDVEKIVPELVFTAKNTGYMGVRYNDAVALLSEAIKELKTQHQQEIDLLKARISQLESS